MELDQMTAVKKLTMGGAAITQFVPELNGWVVAMAGDFDGGVFARIVEGPNDKGNGRLEYDLEHFFTLKDGSTIQTRDKAVVQAVSGHDRVYVNTFYKVQKVTGAFEGLTGTFESWGAAEPGTGRGILRFSGELAGEA
jgi:hypothetical protein